MSEVSKLFKKKYPHTERIVRNIAALLDALSHGRKTPLELANELALHPKTIRRYLTALGPYFPILQGGEGKPGIGAHYWLDRKSNLS